MLKIDAYISYLKFKKGKKVISSPYYIIPFISFLSLWLILFYFFSWEEFAFFYAYQNPEIADTIFKTPGYSNHPILPYLKILFNLFGYNPIPYNILSILIFCLLSIGVFFFSKIVLSLDKKSALYSALIFASGYFGVGTFTTDTYSGFTGGLGVLFVLINLILFKLLIKGFSLPKLLLLILTYLVCIKLFTSRSFALPALYSLIMLFQTRSLFRSLLIGVFSILPIILLFSTQTTQFASAIPHISIKFTDFIESLLANIAHSFVPSLFIKEKAISVLLGLGFMLVSLYKKETKLPILLLVGTLGAQLLAIIVNSQYFSIWQSPNHYFTSLTIFSAPMLAILLKKRQWLMITIIIGLVILSNYQIYTELQNRSNNLRYFYETVQKYVPKRERKTVVLVYTKEPRPLDPFITLPYFSGEIYLPGFYHKKAVDMMVTQSFSDALEYIHKNDLKPEDIYVFTYALYNLKDVSADFWKYLSNNSLEKNSGSIENIEIIGLIPLKVSFNVPSQSFSAQNAEGDNNRLGDFWNWHKNIKITTNPEKPFGDRKKEYLLDSDFETTWIPSQWENPVGLTFTLPSKKAVSRLIWSVSRTSSWPARTPTDYRILISEDGQNWQTVVNISNGNKLLTNEYKVEEINSDLPVFFVRFEIYKTLEGSLPAIDDIQIIPKSLDDYNYQTIENYIAEENRKVCLQWKTNDDAEFRFQRQVCSNTLTNSGKNLIEIEPRIEKILGFRVVDDKQKVLKVDNFEITHPVF